MSFLHISKHIIMFRVSICALILSLNLSFPIYAFQAPSIPIKDVAADAIEFQNKKISLEGNVMIDNDLGTIYCDRAYVSLEDKSKENANLLANKLDLYGQVQIHFADGSKLSADRGEIFFRQHEAIFYASQTEKVTYLSFCTEDNTQVPVLASGKKIIARLIKDNEGKSSLTDIRGEGAVTIEYLRPKTPLTTTTSSIAEEENL